MHPDRIYLPEQGPQIATPTPPDQPHTTYVREDLEPRIAELAPAVPEGWRIERAESGRIIVQKYGIVWYAAEKNGESIAESALYYLADALLSAQQPQTLRQDAPEAEPESQEQAELRHDPDFDPDTYQWPGPHDGWANRSPMQAHGFRQALEVISSTTNLTATPEQFARHLQKFARRTLEAAAQAADGEGK